MLAGKRVLSDGGADYGTDDNLLCSDMELEGLARELLAYGKTFQFVARGSSMQPYIHDGDELSLSTVSSKEIKSGDVLLARTGSNILVVHRVIRIKEKGGKRLFQLQGDDCKQSDGYITGSNVIGKVFQIRRRDKVLDSRKPERTLFTHMQVMLIRWFGKRPVLPLCGQKIFKLLGLI